MLSECCGKSWPGDSARESDSGMGHPSKLVAHLLLSTSAHVTEKADSRVLEKFTRNLLLLGLNWYPNDPILLGSDEDDLLQPFRNHQTDLSELANEWDIPIGMRKS